MERTTFDLAGSATGPRVLVTGSTGTIGRRVVQSLGSARVLSRDPIRAAATHRGVDARAWDGRSRIAPEAFEGVDAVVHLAGEPVAEGRWTARKKREITDSRVLGTRALVDSLRSSRERPAVLVSASAVGYYGDRGDEPLDEASFPGGGFLAEVCKAWEAEALAAAELGIRVVCLRIGVVLDRAGGALPRMVAPFRAGIGGPLGHGKQWVPWIHVDDVVRLIEYAITHDDVAGPLNAVAPTPASNQELARLLGRTLHRPTLLRAPAIALRAALGEAASVVLASQRVLPTVAWRGRFRFTFPTLAEALEDLLAPSPSPHPELPRAHAAT